MAGFSFKKKIIQSHFWQMHIQIAREFSRDNRIFLVGDSAHAFVPTGGFGLNTGLGDVVNLGWKLAAAVTGAADKTILTTYEEERRPVCLQNLKLAQKNADDLMSLRKKYDPQENPEAFAKANAALANQYVNALSATLGYQYGNKVQENIKMNATYKPITESGYFLPHQRLENKMSIYDVLSATHWTLIISGEITEPCLMSPPDAHLDILKLPKDTYPFRFILIRPDWHIVYISNIFSMDVIKSNMKNAMLRNCFQKVIE